MFPDAARQAIDRCRLLSTFTEEPGFTTRTFLSPPMREVHAALGAWMTSAGMSVSVDGAGNLRGVYDAAPTAVRPRRLFIGSHLDSVPHAGAFDGILGVVIGVSLVELLGGKRFPFAIEIVGFSDEEGTRFGAPFIGSRALAGTLDREILDRVDATGRSVTEVIQAFGLDPQHLSDALAGDDAIGYLEFHIEQGPVLDNIDLSLGIVTSIVGQSRYEIRFQGAANHAGTTPMNVRRDALACAVEWIGHVEAMARATSGLVATVGEIHVEPGAANVIPGACNVSLDVRHADDQERVKAVAKMLGEAGKIANDRGLTRSLRERLNHEAVPMDPQLVEALEQAVSRAGVPLLRMASGAGHDAMIMASRMPVSMLFLRSPGGVSHHPDERVEVDDVAVALHAGLEFLEELSRG
jgi:allantoate deiminase